MPEAVSTCLEALLGRLEAFGLFLVPVGELEEWLEGCGITASKTKKWAWANQAADYIRTHPRQNCDIWDFTERLADYLTVQFR